MDNSIHLSLEKQLHLRAVEIEVQSMNKEQAQEMLMRLYHLMLARETMYKKTLGTHWQEVMNFLD